MSANFDEDGRDVPQPIGRDGGGEPGVRAMASVVIAAAVIAGLYFGSVILEPFALAMLLSLMLAPAVRVLRPYIGRVPAVLATVLVAFVLIFGVAASIGDEVFTLAQSLPKYEYNIATKIRSLNGMPGGGIVSRVSKVFQDLSAELSASRSLPLSGLRSNPQIAHPFAAPSGYDPPPKIATLLQQRRPRRCTRISTRWRRLRRFVVRAQ